MKGGQRNERSFGKLKRSALVVGVAYWAVTSSAFAELGPRAPAPDRFWAVLFVQSPIASGGDYRQIVRYYMPESVAMAQAEPDPLFIEIRTAKTFDPVHSFKFTPYGKPPESDRWLWADSMQPRKNELEQLKNLPRGAYVVAFVQEGRRVSNACQFVVDPDFDIETESTLFIEAIEPPPFRQLPFIGVRATGNQKLTTELKNDDVAFADILCDDLIRERQVQAWVGGIAPIRAGERQLRILNIGGNLLPQIARGVPHDIAIKAADYTSNTIRITPDTPMGNAWDATSRPENESEK